MTTGNFFPSEIKQNRKDDRNVVHRQLAYHLGKTWVSVRVVCVTVNLSVRCNYFVFSMVELASGQLIKMKFLCWRLDHYSFNSETPL